MMIVIIRQAALQDVEGLARVHVDTWKTAYRGIISDEVLDRMSYSGRSERWKQTILEPEGKYIFVAVIDYQEDSFGKTKDSSAWGHVATSNGMSKDGMFNDEISKAPSEGLSNAPPGVPGIAPFTCLSGVVGFVMGGLNRDEDANVFKGEIYGIYILDEYQGKGTGRRLFIRGVQSLLQDGMDSVKVWVLADNVKARGFYERLGGKPVDARDIEIGGKWYAEVAYGWHDATVFAASQHS